MNFEKVVFSFFIILALTLNFGFFIGDIDNPDHHGVYELYMALFVNAIVTLLKLGDRTQYGAIHLASSVVATIQLVGAAVVWSWTTDMGHQVILPKDMVTVVSLSGGAFVANIVSIWLLMNETHLPRR